MNKKLRKKLIARRSEIRAQIEKLVGLDEKGEIRAMSEADATSVEDLKKQFKEMGKRLAALDGTATRDDDEEDDEDRDDDEDGDDEDRDDDEDDDEDRDDDEDDDERSRHPGQFASTRTESRTKRAAPRKRRERATGRRSQSWTRNAPAVHTTQHSYSYCRALRNVAEGKPHIGLEGEISRDIELAYHKIAEGILMPTGGEVCDERGTLRYGKVPGILHRTNRSINPGSLSNEYQRDLNVATTGTGAIFVVPELPFIELLRAQLVLRSLGAGFWTNLPPGKFGIPRQSSAATGTWIGELNSTDAAPSTSQPGLTQVVNFVDKTLQVVVPVTRKFLYQSSVAGEQFIRDDASAVIARSIDLAGINGTGSGAQPQGVMQNSTVQTNSTGLAGGTNGAALSWDQAVGMETLVCNANAARGALSYLTNPTLAGKMKRTPKIGSTFPEYLMTGVPGNNVQEGPIGELNGRHVWSTNLVPNNLVKGASGAVCSAILCGYWPDLIIAQWGGIDALVNPYSYQNQGVIQFSMMLELDVQLRHPESFALISDVLTP
jgi:HK97 family phage major capsid protein